MTNLSIPFYHFMASSSHINRRTLWAKISLSFPTLLLDTACRRGSSAAEIKEETGTYLHQRTLLTGPMTSNLEQRPDRGLDSEKRGQFIQESMVLRSTYISRQKPARFSTSETTCLATCLAACLAPGTSPPPLFFSFFWSRPKRSTYVPTYVSANKEVGMYVTTYKTGN